MGNIFTTEITSAALAFVFYYPLLMSYVWMVAAIRYYVKWERSETDSFEQQPVLPEYPPVSIIVPCHNEGPNVRETIAALTQQDYPDFEIIAVNDGSTDDTAEQLGELSHEFSNLRVVHLAKNQGKAMALRMGALASPNEYLICIDGDALLDANATTWMVKHFLSGPRVGAVTGNPRVRTRSTLLGKIQVGEFSSIVGLIKRAQRVYGRIFTISGVIAGFRKSALQDVDYWSIDAITEDIDISWKLQLNGWDIRFEPNALCWILMPETLKGLWAQRLRWAQGGMEVFSKNLSQLWRWRQRRMWLLGFEYLVSVIWTYTIVALLTFWIISLCLPDSETLSATSVLPSSTSLALGLTCLLQFAVSFYIDSRYEKGLGRYYYWMIWYPLAFWLINVLTTAVGVPKAFFTKRGKPAIWISPDRGIQ